MLAFPHFLCTCSCSFAIYVVTNCRSDMFLFLLSWYFTESISNVLFYVQGNLVSSRPNSPSSQNPDIGSWPSGGHSCCLLRRNPRIPDSRGAWVGRKCKQRSESEENHTKASAARHSRRWGARYTHQRYHCWRWCDPSYSQVPH